MAGVRIQHATERSCVLTLVDGKRPYVAPHECPTCHQTHIFKTYHIALDEAGAAVVSPEVAAKLKRIPGAPFRVTGEVKKPPAQVIGIGTGPAPTTPRLVAHEG